MKILTISCYGHGNLGDNMYSKVFEYYLKDHEVKKIRDTNIFVDENGKYFDEPQEKEYNFDCVIIGGGGLITEDKLVNSKNMSHYYELCKKYNKDLYVISCGIQGENHEAILKSWKELLNYAKFITLRSKKDKELVSSVVHDTSKVHYFRDLGYLYPILYPPKKNKNKTESVVTVITAGSVNMYDNQKVIDSVKKYDKIILMNMGGKKDDGNKIKMKNVKIQGKEIQKYYGASKAPEFNFKNKKNKGDITLEKAVEIINNSDYVFTGRYHGMIFSRSLKIPHTTLDMGSNKVLWEEKVKDINSVIENAKNHIKLLREHLYKINIYVKTIPSNHIRGYDITQDYIQEIKQNNEHFENNTANNNNTTNNNVVTTYADNNNNNVIIIIIIIICVIFLTLIVFRNLL